MEYPPDIQLLAGLYSTLGRNGKMILIQFAQRLVMGKNNYGLDFDDGRDFLREALEEMSDAIAYYLAAIYAVQKT